jgi:hypothetical protein
VAKRAGAFKSDKRRKELQRQKKQEEKRQKRLNKDGTPMLEPETTTPEETAVTGEEPAAPAAPAV